MKKTLIALGTWLCLSLSACAVHTPHGSVVLDPDSPHHDGHGDFCPPGQAKKGRC